MYINYFFVGGVTVGALGTDGCVGTFVPLCDWFGFPPELLVDNTFLFLICVSSKHDFKI